MMKNITIKTPLGKRTIGPNNPVFIIAEMSGNHNQSYKRAQKIIDVAAEAKVDAIKLQTYTPDTITIDCDNEYFQVKTNDAWKGQTLYELYKKAYTPWEWQPKLKKYAEKKGILFFSTPFDNTAVDFLEKMDVKLYKVASFEIVDIPLLEKIGKTKKPVIMSRGMASKEEIKLAIKTLKENGCPQIAILHCVSSYPAQPAQMNLATLPDIAKKFNVITGLSDHTLGITAALTSVALGARIIEKHITLSREEGGVDAQFSLEPDELKQLVKSTREVEKSIGKPNYVCDKKEAENIIFRKSVFVVRDIKKGEKFTAKNIRVIRPGYGLSPKYYKELLGKIAKTDISRGTPLTKNLIKKESIARAHDYKIRKARESDAKTIWQIRNRPLMRKKSNNNEKINFSQHREWFRKKYLNDKNNYCFVLVDKNNTVIGYCRFDFKKNDYLSSIAIDIRHHQKGLGNYLLKHALKKLKTKKNIFAEIQKRNFASLKLFQKNNFIVFKKNNLNYYLKYTSPPR